MITQSVFIYHQVAVEDWKDIQKHGLVVHSRGALGDKSILHKTDSFLEEHIPNLLKQAGFSRKNNIYGYIGTATTLIDITSGQPISISEKATEKGLILLKLNIDPLRCWVSDLDRYDSVKQAVLRGERSQRAAKDYWNNLQQLDSYDGSILRPEVMITYDLPPSACMSV